MQIRIAEEKDFDTLMAFMNDWQVYRLLLQGYEVNKDRLAQSIKLLITNRTILVGEMPLGEGDESAIIAAIAGQFMPCMFSDDIFFVGMFLYVVPGHRDRTLEFLDKVESILKLTDTTKFIVSNPSFDGHDKLERFYKQRGFHKLETHMVKTIEKEVSNAGRCHQTSS